jgi:hypothetical protein
MGFYDEYVFNIIFVLRDFQSEKTLSQYGYFALRS